MSPTLVVVAHVLTAFWLVAGIVGRDTCWAQAGRAESLASLRASANLARIFERAMVRPATLVVLLTGLVAGWMRGWPILGFLQGASVNWMLASLVMFLSMAPLIVFVFLPSGRVYRTALADAEVVGEVTPALRRAIKNPMVGMARAYELVGIGVLTWLMIAKPF